LYAIVEELRAGPPAGRTAAWLAGRFEVSARTIKRDVAALQQASVPIWATSGPGGGYALDPAATLPPLTFTPGEATAIAAALSMAPDLPFGPDGRSALTKLLGAMSRPGREKAGQLGTRIWIAVPEEAARNPVAGVVDEALRQSVVLVLDYVDAEGTTTERRPVEPLAFGYRDNRWYLMAWCRRRRAGRFFRFDRIVGADLTTEPFAPRDLVEVFGEPPQGVERLALGSGR
jgi:predicted DNA-binding transcriptional regulator YafY